VKNLGLILIGATLVNNILLIEQIGICPILHLAAVLRRALKVGLALAAVMFISTGLDWLIYRLILPPLGLVFLKNLFFVLTVILVVRIVYRVADRSGLLRDVFAASGETLFSANCLLLAVTFLAIGRNLNLPGALAYALGSGLGFILVVLIFIPIRERLDLAPVIPSFKGMPIYLITFSLMALAFLGGVGFLGWE
jgi:Na+-translocating ferredoxin:NAD+ oxidoreductase RnfA subunit